MRVPGVILMLAAILVMCALMTPVRAGEAQIEIDTYQKVQGKRDWEDYKRWKRNNDDAAWRDQTDRRPTRGACKGWITMEGQKMIGALLARREARKTWERAARSRYSADHADWDFAGGKGESRGGDGFRCWKERPFTRCEARAMACRAS